MVVPRVVEGDLLDQEVEAIVNAWNRNIIPWWLLLPQGVSGAIKRRAGTAPFVELARHGPMPLGTAVATTAGRLNYQGIIHVAGINMLWRASERSILESVVHAVEVADDRRWRSLALPLIGAGSGGFREEDALSLTLEALGGIDSPIQVVVVKYRPPRAQGRATT